MKVKVKRIRGGSMGDQRDYGLVTGSIWNYEDKPTTNNVSGTMTPTSREDATIEAERGETVVGDLNNDGQLEHLKIGGKRHAQGGTPLNVPDGSFVFSDYNGLLIKNKELLANVFNYKSGKSATPAKVASRYELNRYNDILNDPNADFLDQKTAQLMIDNNLKKLGQLALVQESMKGFPDGIPNIALPLFGSDMQAGGSMQKMKKGGLVKAQNGKSVGQQYWANKFQGNMPPRIPANQVIGPNTVRQWQDPNMLSDFALTASSPFATLMSTGYRGDDWRDYVNEQQYNPIDMAIQGASLGLGRVPAYFYNTFPFLIQQEYGGQYMQAAGEKKKKEEESGSGWGIPALGAALAVGTSMAYPYLKSVGKEYIMDPLRRVWNRTEMVPYETTNRKGRTYTVDLPEQRGIGQYVKPILSPQNLKRLGKYGLIGAIGAGTGYLLNRYLNAPTPEAVPASGMESDPYVQDSTATPVFTSLDQVAEDAFAAPDTGATQIVVPDTSGRQTTTQPASQAVRPRVATPRNTTTVLDSSVLDLMSKQYGGYTYPMFQTAGQFTAYTEPSKITSTEDWEVISPGQKFPYKFGVQSFDPSIGTYTIADPSGKNIQLDLSDLYSRLETTEQETGLPIIKSYDKGADQWKKDITSSNPATRKKAVGHAQRAYNEARTKLGLSPYFYGKAGSDPYGIDEMLGLYTFSMPGLRKKKKAQPSAPAAPAADRPVAEGPTYTGPGFQAAAPRRDIGFSPQDVAAMTAVAGQEIPDYLLTSSYMDPSLISQAYTEFDPSATLGAYQAFLQNVGTGPQGKGAALSATGATGKTLEALNRERQANRASNLETFMRTSAANQQALNQANLYNTEEDKAYIDRYNALRAAGAEDRNAKLAAFAKAYGRGRTNIGKLKAINAMLPYQYSDWENTVVNPTLRSIYDEAITGAGSSGASFDSIYQSVFNQLVQSGVDRKEAAIEATEAASRMASSRNRGGYGTSGAASSIYDFLG